MNNDDFLDDQNAFIVYGFFPQYLIFYIAWVYKALPILAYEQPIINFLDNNFYMLERGPCGNSTCTSRANLINTNRFITFRTYVPPPYPLEWDWDDLLFSDRAIIQITSIDLDQHMTIRRIFHRLPVPVCDGLPSGTSCARPKDNLGTYQQENYSCFKFKKCIPTTVYPSAQCAIPNIPRDVYTGYQMVNYYEYPSTCVKNAFQPNRWLIYNISSIK
ncbi:hypothetical protein SAMD00019534_009450 [Acytostelium subglobosum LB1]|uniref:hypothetical protein n=1 Tax=Acytostelium subglobosum LB1 TaxID=1410327 RepID=UPI0006449F90|nr:hypothetical protein SAMD00019534_009450 [Acytostelium subglobosum LB1]GAM17770.1 hypothetical protein SAMD00019534_009450 [Acytostelium subglobosum LB1]|eukprot:XP_012758366.1 hypothetical protein SAMD00019534_009450 [Acytostelium subglobosum LB1]